MGADNQQERPEAREEGQDVFSKIMGTIVLWISIIGFVFGTSIVTLISFLLY